jgi:uncharacterized repeat protein (TIGR01451 family)
MENRMRRMLRALTLCAAVVASAALHASVTIDGPSEAAAGTNVTYTVTVQELQEDVSLSFTYLIPEGMTFVSVAKHGITPGTCQYNPPSASAPNGSVSCQSAGLVSFGTISADITLAIPADAPPGSVYVGLVPFTPTNRVAFLTAIPPAPVADVRVVTTGPATADVGDTVVYTVAVTNDGPSAAYEVRVTASMTPPVGFSLAPSSGPASACSGNLCLIPVLAAGATATFTVQSLVPQAATLTLTASVTNLVIDPNAANNEDSVTTTITGRGDVRLTKTGPAFVLPGMNVVYTLTVVNDGPGSANDVHLFDALPEGTTFVSLVQTSAGPTYDCVQPLPGETGAVNCDLPSLAEGASVTFQLTLNVGSPFAGDELRNTARAFAPADPDDTDNASTAVATLGSAIPTLELPILALLALSLLTVALVMLRKV